MAPITSLSQLDLNKTYTYADYLTWQLNEFVELVRGKICRMSPAPRRVHQEISGYFFGSVYAHLLAQPCKVYHAPFDVRLATTGPDGNEQLTTVVQPDICVVCDPAKLDDAGCLGAPDWIIEIISPRTAAYDTREKFELYQESGVTEYWIVFPGEKTVATYVLENGRYQSHGSYFEPGLLPAHTLPALQLQWERVFEGV